VHPLLKQQLVRAGFNPDAIDSPALKDLLEQIDEQYSGHLPYSPKGTNGAESQSQLLSSSEMLQAVIDAIPGYVSWISSDLVYLGVNQALATSLNMNCSEFPGKRVGFTGRNDAFLDFVQQIFNSGNPQYSCTLQIPDPISGDPLWHSFEARKFHDNNHAVVVGFNIDEIKKQEDTIALQQAQLMASAKMAELGQLAAAIAHEINNPLGVILGNCQILKRNLSAGNFIAEKCFETAEKMEVMAVRIGRIMRSCLSFSRDARSDPFVDIPLQQVINESLELVNGRCLQGKIELEVDDVPPEIILNCRPTQICQVVVNLCNNAIDAIAECDVRWIRLKIDASDDSVVLRVVDSGPGVPENVAGKIFGAFFTTKQAHKGTGLGLNIAAGIVKEHKGELYLERGAEQTTFMVRLPCKRWDRPS
jgi:signal transduction histidine kinase